MLVSCLFGLQRSHWIDQHKHKKMQDTKKQDVSFVFPNCDTIYLGISSDILNHSQIIWYLEIPLSLLCVTSEQLLNVIMWWEIHTSLCLNNSCPAGTHWDMASTVLTLFLLYTSTLRSRYTHAIQNVKLLIYIELIWVLCAWHQQLFIWQQD